jgi:hypothetical protein
MDQRVHLNFAADYIGSGGSQDHIVEQMTPVKTWGKRFVTVPIPARTTGDYFYFIASEDSTTITFAI